MSGWTGTLWRLVHERAPISLVLYGSPGALDDQLESVRLMAPQDLSFLRTTDTADAFTKLDVPLLLTPEDEAGAVSILNGRSEWLIARTAPAFLFLLKDGPGEIALRRSPFLASWLVGRMFDPEPEQIDVAVECKLFEEKTGMSPEAWLAAWQRGEIPDTGWDDSSFIYQRALLLTDDG